MNEPHHFDEGTRGALHEECERLAVIQQRWHQEHFRLKDQAEQAMRKANKAQEAMTAIQKLLEVGKMQLPES